MRYVGPSTFKNIEKCARSFVRGLAPPEDQHWLPFIQKDWPAIVGEALAAQTQPAKLWFARPQSGGGGRLTVSVPSQGAALILQHETGFMRDALNRYYEQELVQTVRLQVQER